MPIEPILDLTQLTDNEVAWVQQGAGLTYAKGTILVADADGNLQTVGVGVDSDVLTADSTQPYGVKWATAGSTGLPVADTTSIVKGSDDGTKQMRFEVDGLSANTTRVLTVQDKDITIADNADLTAHTGDTSNPHSVTKAQVGLGNVPNLLDNLAATAAPTATDDNSAGYSVGSLWCDTSNDNVYVCIDDSASAAIWRLMVVTQDDLPDGATYKQYNPASVNITGGSISGITDLAIADGGTGASDVATAKANLGFMTDLVDDTTPQLGGDLDLNGHNIVANASQKIQLNDSSADTTLRIENTDATYKANLDVEGALSVGVALAAVYGGTGLDTSASSGIPKIASGTWSIDATQDDLGDGTTYKQYNPASVAITGGSISGITDLAVADGGTGASDAAGAKTNLGFMTDLIDDTTPQLGGELDAGAHSIGFTLQSYTGGGGTTTTIDWTKGNKVQFTFGAGDETLDFTAPAKPGNLVLVIIQDSTGGRKATWPSSVKWVGGSAPTLSTAANAVDIIAFLYDGTNYYGVGSLNFS